MDKFANKLRPQPQKTTTAAIKKKEIIAVIYTAIFGNRTNLQKVLYKSPKCDYVCFTDREFDSDLGWQIIKDIPECLVGKSPRYKARYIKINSHLMLPKYYYVLWIDGTIAPKLNLYDLIAVALQKHDIAVSRHPERSCIYEEAKICKKFKKDDNEKIDAQMIRYKDNNYPRNIGLCESGIILRRHRKHIVTFNEIWWGQVVNGSIRDQLSLNYVLYKLNINWYELPNARFPNDYYEKRAK